MLATLARAELKQLDKPQTAFQSTGRKEVTNSWWWGPAGRRLWRSHCSACNALPTLATWTGVLVCRSRWLQRSYCHTEAARSQRDRVLDQALGRAHQTSSYPPAGPPPNPGLLQCHSDPYPGKALHRAHFREIPSFITEHVLKGAFRTERNKLMTDTDIHRENA